MKLWCEQWEIQKETASTREKTWKFSNDFSLRKKRLGKAPVGRLEIRFSNESETSRVCENSRRGGKKIQLKLLDYQLKSSLFLCVKSWNGILSHSLIFCRSSTFNRLITFSRWKKSALHGSFQSSLSHLTCYELFPTISRWKRAHSNFLMMTTGKSECSKIGLFLNRL